MHLLNRKKIYKTNSMSKITIYIVVALIIPFIPTMFNWNTVGFYLLIILTLGASKFLLLLYNDPCKLDLYMGEYVGVFFGYFEYILVNTIACSSFNDTFKLLSITSLISFLHYRVDRFCFYHPYVYLRCRVFFNRFLWISSILL